MNKQALAFLTMFSLILMLSVYYVTLPTDSTSVMEEYTLNLIKKQIRKTQQQRQRMLRARRKKHRNRRKIHQNRQMVQQSRRTASIRKRKRRSTAIPVWLRIPKAMTVQKKEALAAIDELKDEKSMQKSVADLLKKDGYQTAVEINGDTCIISVFEQKDDKNVAKTIMQKVQEATNHKYLMEVIK